MRDSRVHRGRAHMAQPSRALNERSRSLADLRVPCRARKVGSGPDPASRRFDSRVRCVVRYGIVRHIRDSWRQYRNA
eukprot:2629450-Prymnesium_polylepis.1